MRNKLNQEQNSKLQQQRDNLNKRNLEVASMDKRVSELRDRLWKKKAALQHKENLPVCRKTLLYIHVCVCIYTRVCVMYMSVFLRSYTYIHTHIFSSTCTDVERHTRRVEYPCPRFQTRHDLTVDDLILLDLDSVFIFAKLCVKPHAG